MNRSIVIVILSAVLLSPSCSSGKGQTTVATKVEKYYFPAVPEPPEVNEENLEEALRRFRDMNPNYTFFKQMRVRLTEVLYEKHKKAVAKKNNKEAYKAFSTAVRFYNPEEILAGDITADVEKMGDWVERTYSPLGDEAKVMTALIVLMHKRPDDEDIKNKYETLSNWIEEARDGMDDDVERLWEIVDIFEEVSMHVNVPVVTTRLLELYKKRHGVFSQMLKNYEFKGVNFGNLYMKYYYMNSMIEKTSYDILRLYTRMGRPSGALASIEKYKGKRGYDPNIVSILESVTDEPDDSSHYLLLSEVFLDEDYKEAMWCCYHGWKKDPTDYRFPLSISDLYKKNKDLYGAEEYLFIARSLNDKNPQIYIKIIELYMNWLDGTDPEEQNAQALELLDKLEKTYKAFESRWSKMQSPIQWGDIVKRKGNIEYYAGNIDECMEHLTQAGYQSDDTESLLTLGTIYIFKLQTAKALTTLEDALDIQHTSQMKSRYFKLLIVKKMADAARIGGKKKEAEKYYNEALGIAKNLIPYISLDIVDDLHVVEGELNHRLGDRKEALGSFKMAVNLSKDVGTYAKILSYLAGAKDIDSMREMYHLAYTDSSIEKKWKIYFSLWYLALQKLTGVTDDPTPAQVLSMTKGDEWTEALAGYYSGTIPYDEVAGRAVTKGSNVELEFFRAFVFYEQGKTKEFKKLLKATLNTEYYSYYEVAMALEILFDMGALK